MELKQKVPLSDLQKLMEWEQLSEKQQTFLVAYLGNGYDAIKAMLAAYNCKSEASARVLSYKVLGSMPVAILVAIHHGDSPEDAFSKLLFRRLGRGRNTEADAQMFKLYAEVKGYRQSWVIHAQREKQTNPTIKKDVSEKTAPAGNGKLLEGFK